MNPRIDVLSARESPTLSYGAGDSTLHVLEQILQQLNAAVQESVHLGFLVADGARGGAELCVAHHGGVQRLFAVELGVHAVADGIHVADEVAHVAALAGATETLTGGAFQAASEKLAGLYEGAFPVVQAVRLNVAAAFELGEAFLNLFEGAVDHVQLVAAGFFAEDDLADSSGGVEVFGQFGGSAELLVVLGEAGEQAVYFTALVAGFGFCCTGKSASVGGACQGGLLSTIEL